MPVLNPFLRALFQSSVLSQALSAQNYVLLVPTTDSLINAQDKDSGKTYAELVDDEDFLGCHILRIAQDQNAKDASIRESRGKAKTYTTVNNRSVIIKENMLYTNKGFKSLTQAQLLNDQLYQSPAADQQQWLVFFISRPLAGAYTRIHVDVPLLTPPRPQARPDGNNGSKSEGSSQPSKKDIQTFNDLLNSFPMIARQMQPGLERLFNEFGKELGRPLPPPPSRSSTSDSLEGSTQISDGDSAKSNGSLKLPFNSAAFFEDEEDLMRKALETAVTSAIDLFQGVDKQQLSLVGATTDLTGPMVERLIEKYVAESVHDNLLFPRLCAFHRGPDHDLDRRIRQMDCLDAAQIGIALDESKSAKKDLLLRVGKGVTAFRKMGVAGSPQQMLDILLETQKVVSESQGATDEEKSAAPITINADVLVSLLLIVVIRSQVRHLQARLSYMQRFIYIDDVESGEIGYALSTLEAVLSYLATDAGGLRKASKQNQVLWNAVKSGSVDGIRNIFEGSDTVAPVDEVTDTESAPIRPVFSRSLSGKSNLSVEFLAGSTDSLHHDSGVGNLAHVFPFQAAAAAEDGSQKKKKKKVKLATRSMSISSSMSVLSRAATLESTLSGIEGDTSITSLAQTQDVAGNSVLMMAVEAQKPDSLIYLLQLEEHYPIDTVLDDTTWEGATLLSAAIQLSNTELVDIILNHVQQRAELGALRNYLARQDHRGRSSAHYMFNLPRLINRLDDLIPWKLKDKIGHTPLFAICRSYDHINYTSMVLDALGAACRAQADGKALNLQDHTDNKGNTLLHILSDPSILHRVLHHCDADPNCMNDKKFTPLMLASKYGRIDIVRIFFGDPRVDLYLREARGLTAVELAKDDEVRNRIDDLTLFSDSATAQAPDESGRITAIVRSFFVEDGTTRYIIKSGAPHAEAINNTYTITTSRRSLQDFSNLVKWLSADHPASYMPALAPKTFRSPFQIHSRPSKAVLLDAQIQLDRFLKVLMTHPTFSTHEVLWEFFLVPDMQPDQIEARSKLKKDFLHETIEDDYEPLTSKTDLIDIESVVGHSRDVVRRLNVNTRNIIRKGYVYHQAATDVTEALFMTSNSLSDLGPPSTTLPRSHIEAFGKFAAISFTEPPSSPLMVYTSAMSSFQTTISAMQAVLVRPSSLANQIRTAQKSLEKYRSSLAANSLPRKGPFHLNFPGMEESRQRTVRDTEKSIFDAEMEIDSKGKELRYTQEVVLGELAGWTSWREQWGRNEIRRFAQATLVKERERLKNMQRVLGNLRSTGI